MVWQPNILTNCYELSGGYAPPNHPPGALPLDPAGGLPFPRPPVPPPPNPGCATDLMQMFYSIYRVGQKTGLFFRLDNIVTVSHRKACSMSKFSKFYREKSYKTRISMSLNILRQICSNHHNSRNYAIYDQNTWILLNLH